jgi:hypothetical protein
MLPSADQAEFSMLIFEYGKHSGMVEILKLASNMQLYQLSIVQV